MFDNNSTVVSISTFLNAKAKKIIVSKKGKINPKTFSRYFYFLYLRSITLIPSGGVNEKIEADMLFSISMVLNVNV